MKVHCAGKLQEFTATFTYWICDGHPHSVPLCEEDAARRASRATEHPPSPGPLPSSAPTGRQQLLHLHQTSSLLHLLRPRAACCHPDQSWVREVRPDHRFSSMFLSFWKQLQFDVCMLMCVYVCMCSHAEVLLLLALAFRYYNTYEVAASSFGV